MPNSRTMKTNKHEIVYVWYISDLIGWARQKKETIYEDDEKARIRYKNQNFLNFHSKETITAWFCETRPWTRETPEDDVFIEIRNTRKKEKRGFWHYQIYFLKRPRQRERKIEKDRK